MASARQAILMLTPDQGHLDRRIAQEATTLAARGWSVDIFATHETLEPPAGMLAPNVRMLPAPRQSRASIARRVKHLLRDRAPALHRLADHAQSRFSDRAGQLVSWNLEHLVSFGPYDVVFAHDIPVLPLALRLKARFNCSVICDLHEIFPEMDTAASALSTRSYWRRVEAENLPQADAILCVNAAVEQYVVASYAPKAPIAVVQNAVPFLAEPRRPGFQVKALFGVTDDRRVLVFAGRLEADTNIETLVSGFGDAHLDGWLLALLGAGPLHERLVSVVQDNDLKGRVFLGRRVPEPDLVPTLAWAHAGALPYQPVDRNHQISTPNKLFEYTQARLPIAASRLTMIERFITGHSNGAFVDYSSRATTARDLRRFVTTDLPTFSGQTLERAARNASWEAEEEALVSIVDRARRPIVHRIW